MIWLSSFVLRHRLAVALVWLAGLLAGGYAASGISHRLTKEFAVPGARSYRTNQLIARTFGNGGGGYPDVVIVTLPAGLTIESPGVAARVRAALTRVSRDPRVRLLSPFGPAAPRLVSADRRMIVALVFKPFHGELQTASFAPEIMRAAAARLPGGATVRVTGIDELASGGGGTQGFGVLAETVLAGLAALAVLAFVFGSLLALVPLVLAFASIMTTFLLLTGSRAHDGQPIVQYLIALIGLGVAIDYSLLVATRWREELLERPRPPTRRCSARWTPPAVPSCSAASRSRSACSR